MTASTSVEKIKIIGTYDYFKKEVLIFRESNGNNNKTHNKADQQR
jgi:hypothetical protein